MCFRIFSSVCLYCALSSSCVYFVLLRPTSRNRSCTKRQSRIFNNTGPTTDFCKTIGDCTGIFSELLEALRSLWLWLQAHSYLVNLVPYPIPPAVLSPPLTPSWLAQLHCRQHLASQHCLWLSTSPRIYAGELSTSKIIIAAGV